MSEPTAAELAVSIVMSTYNKAAQLHLSLESIASQGIPFPYEVIVVDDGSQDTTAQTCEQFLESLPLTYAYLDRPFYCNPAKARNLGILLARADRIIIQSEVIHGDDVVEELTRRLEHGYFDFATVYNGNKHKKRELYCGLANPRPFFFCGIAWREDLFAVGGNDEDFYYSGFEDNWLAACLIRGRGLQPRFWDDLSAWHLEHERPSWSVAAQEEMGRLYQHKERLGEMRAATSLLWDARGGQSELTRINYPTRTHMPVATTP